MTIKHINWVVLVVLLMVLGCLVTWFLKLPPGPANPVVARDLIQSVVPASWAVVASTERQTAMTEEYFPDGRVQTLALVGPQVDHIHWTDYQLNTHVEDWSKECLLLWIVPSGFKPKFPNILDEMASGVDLPDQIFSSKHVCVYGYVTNSGVDINRIRELGKKCTEISTDAVNPSWVNWARDIEAKLGSAEQH